MSIDDLRRDVDDARAGVADIMATLRALRICERYRAPLSPLTIEKIAAAHAAIVSDLDVAEAAVDAARDRLKVGLARVAALAQTIVAAARDWRLALLAEEELLELLGTEELPADGLTPAEHRYVVATLAYREATGHAVEDALIEWTKARRALLADGRMAA